jgi:hypothetical protein
MTPEMCAYIAGLLDADGWISMHRANTGQNHRSGHNWLIGIVNSDLAVLRWVQELFGGSVTERKSNRRSPVARNWKTVYDWNPDAKGVANFLQSILPYLRIKKAQAELVLEFIATKQDRRKQYRLTDEVVSRREDIYHSIRALNHMGVAPMQPIERVH